MQLKEIYEISGKTVLTAHRGWSGRYPENTLTAFMKAIEIGVDIVEFDVRETSDEELVVIHDSTLDRTTDGTGPVSRIALAQLKCLNASFWKGPHDTGQRTTIPSGKETILTLEETLSALCGKVGLNIQVYVAKPVSIQKIIKLYSDLDLYDTAFLMLASFDQAEYVRSLDSKVAVCIAEDRSNIERHVRYGVDFIQPCLADLSSDYVRQVKSAKIRANVFYANTSEDVEKILDLGLTGILTDCPDRVSKMIDNHVSPESV